MAQNTNRPKLSEKGLLTPDNCIVTIIDLQPQMLLDPLRQGSDQPIGTRLTADVDVTIIRISAETVPPLLQFSVEWIQIDVG